MAVSAAFAPPPWRCAIFRCRSSVVEHPLGKGEVHSSILCGSTRFSNDHQALRATLSLFPHATRLNKSRILPANWGKSRGLCSGSVLELKSVSVQQSLLARQSKTVPLWTDFARAVLTHMIFSPGTTSTSCEKMIKNPCIKRLFRPTPRTNVTLRSINASCHSR
jgi:hypothetical protein